MSLQKKIVYGFALGLIFITGTSFAQSGRAGGGNVTAAEKALQESSRAATPVRSVGQETKVTWSCQVECQSEKNSQIALGQIKAPTRIQNAAGSNTKNVNAGSAQVVQAARACVAGGKASLEDAYVGLQNAIGSMSPGCSPCSVTKDQLASFKSVGQTCQNSKSGVAMKVADIQSNLAGSSTLPNTDAPAAQ
jgi:hypothetical protein